MRTIDFRSEWKQTVTAVRNRRMSEIHDVGAKNPGLESPSEHWQNDNGETDYNCDHVSNAEHG